MGKIVNCLLAESDDVEPDEEPVAYANPMRVLLDKKKCCCISIYSIEGDKEN